MAPQLYISVYKEQFSSPHGAKRAPLRPTSAHRRNNPQPRPDFLFPRSLGPSYKSTRSLPQPSPPVDFDRPLFPPVTHFSFHSPVTTGPGNYPRSAEAGKPQHMPPVNAALPSADKLQKLQLTEPPAAAGVHFHSALKEPPRGTDYLRNVQPLSAAQRLRQRAGAQHRTKPQTSNPSGARHQFPRAQYDTTHSNSSLDHSSRCYSCFHVVKPFQAGHFIIHPEFVSECLP